VLNAKAIPSIPIPDSVILDEGSQEFDQVAPGFQVVFAGFFYQFYGSKRIQPIVRQGVIAMMPDDEVPTVLKDKKGSVFLIDAHSYHGNSGSPVFVNVGGIHGGSLSGDSYKLFGVVSGYYPERDGSTLSEPAVLTGAVHDNSGITIVVPAGQLKNLLNADELRTLRESDIQRNYVKH
jgi:hypothetical protein